MNASIPAINYESMFDALFPGYFEKEFIRSLPEDDVSCEMVLPLADFQDGGPLTGLPQGVRFGFYRGEAAPLLQAVNAVDEGWAQYFANTERCFCATLGDQVLSFCIVDEMGVYDGLRVGGPGCVGTVPAFRRQGVGLELVRRATLILKQRGFDLSYIHYTHVDRWYEHLGYQTVLRWTCRGFVRQP